MKKMITLVLLICLVLPGIAQAASNSYYCPDCQRSYDFDPRDSAYMESWIANHKAMHAGGGSSGETRHIDWSRVSLPSYLFLGGVFGGTLGGLYGLAYAQPQLWYYAGIGAFLGGIFMGLMWVVNAT